MANDLPSWNLDILDPMEMILDLDLLICHARDEKKTKIRKKKTTYDVNIVLDLREYGKKGEN